MSTSEDKAVFKNPEIRKYPSYWTVESSDTDFESFAFDEDAYDMEVTFTRKAPDLKVGDHIYIHDSGLIFEVLGVSEDHVWARPFEGTLASRPGNIYARVNVKPV